MSILSIPLRLFGGWEGVSPRQRKWERVLEAALTAPRYRSMRARLEWARHTSRFRIDCDFADPVTLRDFLEHVGEFRSTLGHEPVPAPLAAPWPGARGGLAIRPWFPVESGVAILQRSGLSEVQRSAPELIAGSVETLRELAAAVMASRTRLESLRWGVIAWTGPGRSAMTAPDRSLFWHAFGVPVWEQLRGFHGELLAEQCELAQGWHLNEENAIWEVPAHHARGMLVTSLVNLRHPVLRLEIGVEGRLAPGRCECGREGPRAIPSP